MTITITHPKVSAKSNSADSTLVQPSDWNAAHTISAAAGKVLGTLVGSTTVSELPIAVDASGQSVILTPGTTGARPSSPLGGMLRYNTSSANYEFYNGSVWSNMAATSSSGFTAVNKAGDTMTGALVAPGLNSTNGVNSSSDTFPQLGLYTITGGVQRACVFVDVSQNQFHLRHSQVDGSGSRDWLVYDYPTNKLYFSIDGGVGSSSAFINGNIILHSGNIGIYAALVGGSNAGGTWPINITGTAAVAASVAWSNISSIPSNIIYNGVGYNVSLGNVVASGVVDASGGFACRPGTGSSSHGNAFNIDWDSVYPNLWIDTTSEGRIITQARGGLAIPTDTPVTGDYLIYAKQGSPNSLFRVAVTIGGGSGLGSGGGGS